MQRQTIAEKFAPVVEQVQNNEVVKAAVTAAIGYIRGRDLERETALDRALRRNFAAFVSATALFALTDDRFPMAEVAVGTPGWRERLGRLNEARLDELYQIEPFIVRYEQVVRRNRRVRGGLPIPEVTLRHYRHVAAVAAKVARMIAAGHDPNWIADAMEGEPHYKGPPSNRRPSVG